MEKTLNKRWFGGVNARDWSAVESLYAEEARIHGKEGERRGGAAVVELAKQWVEALPDLQITPLHTSRESGEVIVVHWRAEGTHEAAIREIPATGHTVAFHGLTSFRCKDDKVVEHWATVDYQPLKAAFAPTSV